LNLHFLPTGNYAAEIYSDMVDDDINPNNLLKSIKTLTTADTITIELAARGGNAIRSVKIIKSVHLSK